MAARRPEAAEVREVLVQVEEDRAGKVALEVGAVPVAGPPEVPAQIDDDGRGGTIQPLGEAVDGDERRTIDSP